MTRAPRPLTPAPLPEGRGGVPPEAPRDCSLCPRLVTYRESVAAREPDWFNGAVPSFGVETARLLVVGLAPGVTGANRTGRPFTGDWAGDLLYATLEKFGFSSGTYAASPDDGLQLEDAMITNACRPFLQSRIAALPDLRVLLCLGKISHDSTVRTLGLKLSAHSFGHNTRYDVEFEGRPLTLLSSYHCSRYNTNTKRLTPEMFEDVFAVAKEIVG